MNGREKPHVIVVGDHGAINGGQAKVAIDSAIGLARAGYRVTFFAATGPVDPRVAAAGARVVCLGQTDLLGHASKAAAAWQGVWNSAAARALEDVLARAPRGETLVHVHGWARALSAAIAGPIRASGLPALYTMHEYFLLCPNGGFYNYPRDHVCPHKPMSPACWTSNCDSRNYVRKVWRCLRQSVMLHRARLPEVFGDYVLISRFQQHVAGPYLPAGARTHHVSNPIDCEDLGPKPEPATGDFLVVGRVAMEKGVSVFAEAARRAGVAPVFAGDGPALAQLKASYPEARCLGWKSPAEVKTLMRSARALVFPSLWFEGQPLTVLEAKAMGAPVIVSDGCAGREEVRDGVTGLWFAHADADSLAGALRKAKDDAMIAAMSQAAYHAFWADPPTLQRHVERIGAVYAEILNRAA